MKTKNPIRIGIIMGSESDFPTMKSAAQILDRLKIRFELQVVSAHRTPQKMFDYATQAAERGIKVLIAGAGGAAHLPGMVASLTHLPVIGVPVETKSLKGMDSLLSIVQMPPGIPVATMAIGNATNAGLLAVRILALEDKNIAKRLDQFNKEQILKVKKMNQNIKAYSRSRLSKKKWA